ncbi:conjugal transfer protein TraF [Deferribacter abyssi]|uniref:conjugal transfer protein TraF n=1 Tax=Deferribacter abyssi TaxID=213806 RepID=UPI003C2092D7
MRKVFVIFIILLSINTFATAFKEDDPKKGWFWYKDPIKQKTEEKKKQVKNDNKSKETRVTIIKPPSKQEKKKKVVNTSPEDFEFPLTDEAKRVPVIANFLKNPNEENAKKFLGWQAKYFNHLHKISRTLRDTYLNYGDMVYPLEGYAEQPLAVPIASRMKNKIYKDAFAKARDKVGLLFFYKAGCQFCEAEKPIIDMFARKYDIDVRGVVFSKDDEDDSLSFPTRVAPGLFYKFQITSVPTFAVYYPEKDVFQVIAKGYTPLSAIELNLKSFLLQQGIITKEEFFQQWKGEYTEIFYNVLSKSGVNPNNVSVSNINVLGGNR